MVIPPASLTDPFYEGSVQRLFAVPGNDGVMVTQTTDRGSVFDVGALFAIPGHDVNRAVFRHVLYTRLSDPGLWHGVRSAIEADPHLEETCRRELLAGTLEDCCARGARTHHEGMLDAVTGEVVTGELPEHPSAFNVVRRYRIRKPERVDWLGAHLFDYAPYATDDCFVIPLEYIVRFGITSASSVYRRYRAMDESSRSRFERELGVTRPLEAWQVLERPIGDFTTKFEPEDRMVSKQEAFAMSGLDGTLFVDSAKLAILGAWAVRHLVEDTGLLLWDIKWEFAKAGDDVVFVDTIDTDSFRATRFFEIEGRRVVNHYNKQAMRDYFTLFHGDWIAAIGEAKEVGRREGVDFTGILLSGQDEGRYPETPIVDPEFLAIQERKMCLVRDHMTGARDSSLVNAGLDDTGREEIAYYREAGKWEEFLAINAAE